MADRDTPEPCTVLGFKRGPSEGHRRHYSTALREASDGIGRRGMTLCGQRDAVSQMRANMLLRGQAPHLRDLHPCRCCALVMRRLGHSTVMT